MKGKISKSDVKFLSGLYSTKNEVYKEAIQNAISLYQDRKIEKLVTLKNLLHDLSKNKKSGLSKLETYKLNASVKGRGKRQDAEVLYKTKLSSITSFGDHKQALKNTVDTLKNSKYKDFKYTQLQASMNKKKLIQVMIKKDNMTKQDIQTLTDKMSKDFSKDGVHGAFSVALKYEKGWRSGYFEDFGHDAHLYSEDIYDKDHHHYVHSQDSFNQFVFYAYEKSGSSGGSSKNNDCLYQCLSSVLYNDLPFKSDYDLKKFLKIPINSKVDISLISKIETKLKNIQINVTGDYVYISNIKSNKVINLKLLNEHYTLDINKQNAKVKHVSYKDRKPIIYDKNTFMCFDGKKEFYLTKEHRTDIFKWRTNYILVNKNYGESFEKEYLMFQQDAEILKKESNGLINLFKTGNNKTTALELFDRFTKHISTNKLKQVESNFISKVSGALIFHEKYEGPAYQYDIKSMYPSIMKSSQLFPIKEGELKYITKLSEKDYYEFGIYRCIIKGSDKIFKFNKHNHYTHIDLKCAKELGLNIDLIIDDQPNFIYYSRDKLITGNELFGQFVDVMFSLKEKKLTQRSKQILNILWGALCEKNTKKKIIMPKDKLLIEQDSKLISIRPFNDDSTIFEYSRNDDQYKSGFARIGPFLMSKGRKIISDIMKPYKDIVVRCHTDGIVLKENPIGIKSGSELGELSFDGYCAHANVLNSNIVLGEFEK